jgi:hypothetical protein
VNTQTILTTGIGTDVLDPMGDWWANEPAFVPGNADDLDNWLALLGNEPTV